MASWNTAYEAAPAGSADPSTLDTVIQGVKTDVRTRVAHEHKTDLSSGAVADDWWHLEGSARCYVTDTKPTTRPDGATALNADDDGRIWYQPSTKKLFVYVGASLDFIEFGVLVGSTATDLSSLVNQDVRTTASPTFAEVTATLIHGTFDGDFSGTADKIRTSAPLAPADGDIWVE